MSYRKRLLAFVVCCPLLTATHAAAQPRTRTDYPFDKDYSPGGQPPGESRTLVELLDLWNEATWDSVVDGSFWVDGSLAAVRKYDGESAGRLLSYDWWCADYYTDPADLSEPLSRFCGVSDQLSGVLLSLAVGGRQDLFEPVFEFSQNIRMKNYLDPGDDDPEHDSELQCWAYVIDGTQASPTDRIRCQLKDSASDASLRILGAYGIACAKERAGFWSRTGEPYCDAYERQGWAVWGNSLPGREDERKGEIRRIPRQGGGEQYFLTTGLNNNQNQTPEKCESFRPDYYELQFLQDFAEYVDSELGDAASAQEMAAGVQDMQGHFLLATGAGTQVARGRFGFFDAMATTYTAEHDGGGTELDCYDGTPPYTCQCTLLPLETRSDTSDTFRAFPALGLLAAVHPEALAGGGPLYQSWWDNYGGGNPAYPADGPKPETLAADTPAPAPIDVTDRYLTAVMWLPLTAANQNPAARSYAELAVENLVSHYDFAARSFDDTGFYGDYTSQFAQRALASVAGLTDPACYLNPACYPAAGAGNLIVNGDFSIPDLPGTGWGLDDGPGSATAAVIDGEACIEMLDPGTAFWDVNFSQAGVFLSAGESYRLRYRASADPAKQINVRLWSAGQPSPPFEETVGLGPTMTLFESTFGPLAQTLTATLEFRVGGGSPGVVCLDDVWLAPEGEPLPGSEALVTHLIQGTGSFVELGQRDDVWLAYASESVGAGLHTARLQLRYQAATPVGQIALASRFKTTTPDSIGQVRIFNVALGRWDVLAMLRPADEDPTTGWWDFTWSTNQPMDYLGTSGQVRLEILTRDTVSGYDMLIDQAQIVTQ